MTPLFARMLDQYVPKVNPVIMDGVGTLFLKNAEECLDLVFKSASKSFPEGLVYCGYSRCTPLEEYIETTKVKNNKRVFDLAKSDIYMLKYSFTYQGVPIKDRYMSLLFDNDGSLFYLGGSKYHITPVLSDDVISPGLNTVFVRLLRDKIMFKRSAYSFVVNNRRETTYVCWARIYRKPSETKKVMVTTKADTTMAHYLFAKHGFNETFIRYCGFIPVVGDRDINIENYPESKWVICESSQVKPKTYVWDVYIPSQMRIAIPIDKWNPLVKGLVIGFFYVVDHFPDRFKAEYVHNKNLWVILLGEIIFSGKFSSGKLYSGIEEHFASLDYYIDGIVLEKLKETTFGKQINDFYDLMAMVVGNFNSLTLDSDKNITSQYGKTLEVLYYLLYDITSSIFRVSFKLDKLARKKTLTAKDIIETLNKNLTPGVIFSLTANKIICSPFSYSGDNKYFKATSTIAVQESLPGSTRGKTSKRLPRGTDKHIDGSKVEVGSILGLSKSNPDPMGRLNPYARIDLRTGKILQNPDLIDCLAELDDLLTRPNSSLNEVDVIEGELDVE